MERNEIKRLPKSRVRGEFSIVAIFGFLKKDQIDDTYEVLNLRLNGDEWVRG